MPTATRRRKVSATRVLPPIRQWFTQWLGIKDEAEVLAERQETLRVNMLKTVEDFGELDEKGHSWLALDEPVVFEDHEGNVIKYSHLKRELHLTPANPTPDPAKAEALLRKKKLWLTPAQEKVIIDLQTANPFVTISCGVDVNQVARLLFSNKISDQEYEATLREQKPSYQFHPSKS